MNSTDENIQETENQKLSFKASIAITIVTMLVMFAFIWLVFSVLVPKGSWFNKVDGSSMEPTLQDGQMVFTDMSDLSYGDIVTARFPASVVAQDPAREDDLVIKRLIGLPGDTIRITTEGVYVNEQLLEEDYLPEANKQYTYIQGRQHEFVLAEDEYFIIGDNRQVSYDSRSFGPVKDTDLFYKQSEKPTMNFAFKVGLIVIIVLMIIFLYSVVERFITRCFLRIRKIK